MTPSPSNVVERRASALPGRAAIGAIRLYQFVRAGRPSPCRYWPTCSEYAREAYGVHGFWRGTALTAHRLLRCRPGAASGWDPVPAPGEHARREGHTAAEGGPEPFTGSPGRAPSEARPALPGTAWSAAKGGTPQFVGAKGDRVGAN